MLANWDTLKLLDDAAEYLQSEAGTRDIFWTNELQDAMEAIQDLASSLRKKLSIKEDSKGGKK